MTKIYEALENARQALTDSGKISSMPVFETTHQEAQDLSMEEEMLGLYKTIDSLLPHLPRKIIQFIGSRQGEGTSTVVRELARIAATKIGKQVLLLDADRHQPSHKLHFGIELGYSWQEAIKDGEMIEKACQQVRETPLFVSPSANTSSFTPEIFDSPRFDEFWKSLYQHFDLILIDSSPLSLSPDGLAIAPKVDGVVLVLEAEKTRWQLVKSVNERITKVGGNVLGIVFNKRRYHIPQVIYNNL